MPRSSWVDFAARPADDVWRSVLGVDVEIIEEELADETTVARWLEGFSLPVLSYIATGHTEGPFVVSRRRADLIRELLRSHRLGADGKRLGLIYRVHRLLRGRRQHAVAAAAHVVQTRMNVSLRPDPHVNEQEKHLILAIEAAQRDLSLLQVYPLLDRAARVRFQRYRLVAGDGEAVMKGIAALKHHHVGRAFSFLYGAGDHARFIDALTLPDQSMQLHLLRRGRRSPVSTFDGTLHVWTGDWIIITFGPRPDALAVHGPGEEGVRLAETIAGSVTGQTVIYEG